MWRARGRKHSAIAAAGLVLTSWLGVSGAPPAGAANCGLLLGKAYAVTDPAAGPLDDGGSVATVLRAAGLGSVRSIGQGVTTFSAPGAGSLDLARTALAAAGLAASVAPDLARSWHAAPNDPGFADQWMFPAVHASEAWDITKGSSSIVVADIDSGVDATHPELAGKLTKGFDGTTGQPMNGGNSDEIGHGTATAGMIGAATSNSTGLSSLGWDTMVMPIKAGNTPMVSAVIAGLRYAADNGARVVNMSLGSECASEDEANAVKYAQDRGLLVVASSGNEKNEGNPVEYPAAYPDVVAVGATGPNGTVANYSNTGSYVTLVAPGGSGTSSRSTGILLLDTGGGYAIGIGTSFSSPLVAAAAGLVFAQNPNLTGLEVRSRLVSTAQDRGAPGRDDEYGAGILDAASAVGAAGGGGGGTQTGDPVNRLSGSDRMATAVAISQSSFSAGGSAVNAVLARADVAADALAGTPLAVAKDGPLLLTQSDRLDDRTANELRRVLPSGATVYLLGGTSALTAGVASSVSSLGFTVVRIAGTDRFDTAVRIARDGLGNPPTLLVADGLTFADALIAGSAAPKVSGAVVLSAGGSVPAASRSYLDSRPGTTRYAIGSAAANAERSATAIAGSNAPDTSRRVAERFFPGVTVVALASASNFPDSLGGGAHIAAKGGPLLLTDPSTLSAPVKEYLSANRSSIAEGFLYGGPAAVAEGVRSAAQQALT